MIGLITSVVAVGAIELFSSGVMLAVTVYSCSKTGRTTRTTRKK